MIGLAGYKKERKRHLAVLCRDKKQLCQQPVRDESSKEAAINLMWEVAKRVEMGQEPYAARDALTAEMNGVEQTPEKSAAPAEKNENKMKKEQKETKQRVSVIDMGLDGMSEWLSSAAAGGI